MSIFAVHPLNFYPQADVYKKSTITSLSENGPSEEDSQIAVRQPNRGYTKIADPKSKPLCGGLLK